MHTLATLFQSAATPQAYATHYVEHLAKVLAAWDRDVIAAIIEAFEETSQAGRTIYFMANGGSAAAATHWVNDLVAGAYQPDQPGFRAISLADNTATVTALGNDAGFENLFVRQLEVMLQPGDLVYAMSVSGNSENIIRGIDYARAHGAKTIGIAGMTGGRLLGRCDINLHIAASADEYGPVEDAFAILEHIVSGYLTMRRGKWLHH
jgi:D-sedoheptulose 7-phosphate isomerase